MSSSYLQEYIFTYIYSKEINSLGIKFTTYTESNVQSPKEQKNSNRAFCDNAIKRKSSNCDSNVIFLYLGRPESVLHLKVRILFFF